MNDGPSAEKSLTMKNRRGTVSPSAALCAVLDWFVPPSIRGEGSDQLRRARLLVVFSWILILLAILYAALFLSMNSPIGAAALAMGAVVGVASLWAMRRTGSQLIAGNLLAAAFFGTLTALACRLGGHLAHSLPWYVGVPVVALSTAGRRSAALWFAVTASSLIAFYLLYLGGYSFPNDLNPHHYQLLGVLSWTGLVTLILSLALVYERAMSRALAELRSAEHRLRREKHFSDSAIASLPGIFYLFDSQGTFLRWNENFEHVSGYSRQEMSKMHPPDFFRGQDKEVIEQRIADVFTHGQAATEARFVAKNGTSIPYLFSGKRLVIDDKPHLVGMGIDIADRKRAEEALREAREFIETALAQSPSGIVIADAPDVTIRLANQAALGVRGGDQSILTGIDMAQHAANWQTYRPDGSPYPSEQLPLSRAVLQGETVQNEEVIVRDVEGTDHWITVNAAPIRDAEGRVSAGIAIFNDITRQKQTETELARARDVAEAATRAKSEFLANTSHEIRTPMTAILGYADLLLQGDVSEEERQEFVQTIRSNGEHLLGIINDILDISKIEAGKISVEQALCSPCRVADEVVSWMRARAAAKGLSLDVEYPGPIPAIISTDVTRLRQILVNLLGNAIKFTGAGSVRLIVEMLDDPKAPDPRIGFEVVDTGLGMAPEQLSEIFQPFSQADSSTTRHFGGTGLGLTISRRFAQMLGGEITAQSELGEGSRFLATIRTGPLDGVRMLQPGGETETSTKEQGAERSSIRARLAGRLLLAEDGRDNQRFLTFVLEKAGARVTLAEDGHVAVEEILRAQRAGRPFDCILMDMEMPVVDGYQAVLQLREAGCRTPIIALTAHSMRGDRDRCLQAGCDAYAAKPIEPGMLVRLVARYCQAKPEEAGLPSES